VAITSSGKVQRLSLAVGDQIRFTKRNDDLGVINGSTAKILKIEKGKKGQEKLFLQMGSEIKSVSISDLADDKGRVPLTHNYATTIYSAQGMTVDRAFVLADSSLKRNEIYVAVSRAKVATELVVDESEVEQKVRQKDLLCDRGLAVPERSANRNELVSGWSAVQEKISTLDYQARTDDQMQRSIKTRLRHREPEVTKGKVSHVTKDYQAEL